MSASAPSLLPLSVTGVVATSSTASVRMPFDARAAAVTVAVGTAPVGAAMTGTVTKKTGAAAAVEIGSWSIAAAAFSAVATLSATDGANEIAAGDVVTLVVSQVGSSTAGSNLTALVQLDQAADQDGVNVHSVAVKRGNHPGGQV